MHGQDLFYIWTAYREKNDVICKKPFVCLDCWKMASECIVVERFFPLIFFFYFEMIESHMVIRNNTE